MRRPRLRSAEGIIRRRGVAGQLLAVLNGVREGVLIVGSDRRVLLINDEARRLLSIPPGAEGLSLEQIGIDRSVADTVGANCPPAEAVLSVGDKVLAVNHRRTAAGGRFQGCVVSLRDITEHRALAGELDSVRELAEKLHTQAHEAANRLHTVVTLVQLKKYRQAIDFGTATLTGIQHLAENLLATIDEPALAALLLSKAAQANERGVDFTVTSDTSFRAFDIDTIDLITLVGNLLDNAIDAAQTTAAGNGQVSITIRADLQTCFVRVTDTGPGLRPEQEDRAFSWGWTTKRAADGQSAGRGIGLTLVWQVVHRHRGTITVDSENSTVFTVRLFAPSRAPAFAAPSRLGTIDAPVPLEPA